MKFTPQIQRPLDSEGSTPVLLPTRCREPRTECVDSGYVTDVNSGHAVDLAHYARLEKHALRKTLNEFHVTVVAG